jgi:hypothetical protein
MLDPEVLEEIREQKKIDRAEDYRDFGPDPDLGEESYEMDRYEAIFGLVGP